ncbi:MAG: hypothetical protein KJ897_04745, partial [Alphaproteobacteria bacterium]|nr:hypothetical protein [Alphaproteobacteria bacterium]
MANAVPLAGGALSGAVQSQPPGRVPIRPRHAGEGGGQRSGPVADMPRSMRTPRAIPPQGA